MSNSKGVIGEEICYCCNVAGYRVGAGGKPFRLACPELVKGASRSTFLSQGRSFLPLTLYVPDLDRRECRT